MIPSLLFEGRECVLCIFVFPMNNPLIDVQQMKCIQPLNRHSLKISATDDRTNATIVGHIYASSSLKFRKLGLPWWSSGWKLTLQCRRQRFNPWSGRIQHATKLLCLWATTTELLLLTCMPGARAQQQEKPLQWEACAPQLENSPHSLRLEKACMQQRRPTTVKM